MKEQFLPEMDGPLAVVDMAISDKSVLAKTIRQASIECGFFYLVNHGIEQELIDDVLLQSKRFFDLSLDEKLKVSHDVNHRGYTPMAEEILDPLNSKQGDTKEGYYIGWEVSVDDPLSTKPLHGPNQWPSEGDHRSVDWVEGDYAEVLLRSLCRNELWFLLRRKLGHAVASLIALALDLDDDFFKNMFTIPMVALRLLHYTGIRQQPISVVFSSYLNEPIKFQDISVMAAHSDCGCSIPFNLRQALKAEFSSPEEGKFGCGAHSDYGLLTFLATDSNSGLQICREKDAVPSVWEDVAPMKGAFIVNLGDMLERWTNGLFRSTLHRVISKGVDRYSVPVFYEPNFDTLVECLPTCCSANNPPKYPPIISGEHLLGKYIDTHSGYDATAKPLL